MGVNGEGRGARARARARAGGGAERLGLGVGFGNGCGGDGRRDKRVVSGSAPAGWDGYEGILGMMSRMLLHTWLGSRS